MKRRGRVAAGVAAVASGFDLLVLAFLHMVNNDVDALTEPTSNYALGEYGRLAAVATFAVGLGALAAAVVLGCRLPRSGRRTVGVGLLCVYGAAKAVQAFFPIDPVGGSSTAGTLHNVLGNLAFFTFPVAAALSSLAVTGAARPAAAFDRVLAAVGWACVPAAVLVLAGDALGMFGLAQRVFLVLASLFVLLVGVRFLTNPGPAQRSA